MENTRNTKCRLVSIDCNPRAYSTDWWYYVWIKPCLLKAASLLFIVASLILVWSESTFQISSITLSIPRLMIKDLKSYFTVEAWFIITKDSDLVDDFYGLHSLHVYLHIFHALQNQDFRLLSNGSRTSHG